MIRQLAELLTGEATYQMLRPRIIDLECANDPLRLENARLRIENRRLRKHQHQLRRDIRLIREAYYDAACLCAWHVAGLAITRRDCQAQECPRASGRERALLRIGRIHNGRTLKTTNPDELHAALHSAKIMAEREPYRLKLYMPKICIACVMVSFCPLCVTLIASESVTNSATRM